MLNDSLGGFDCSGLDKESVFKYNKLRVDKNMEIDHYFPFTFSSFHIVVTSGHDPNYVAESLGGKEKNFGLDKGAYLGLAIVLTIMSCYLSV